MKSEPPGVLFFKFYKITEFIQKQSLYVHLFLMHK